jgi:hypothetical protein
MTTNLTEGGIILALTIGLTALINKTLGEDSGHKKFLPLIAVCISILLSNLLNGFNIANTLQGLVIGLTSCGLYDQKKVIK